MFGPDINTEINNIVGPINSEIQMSLSSNQGMIQNIQQPNFRQPPRIKRHTVEMEKSVANGYLMLGIIFAIIFTEIILIVVLSINGITDYWPILPVLFLLFFFLLISCKGSK